MPDLIIKTTNDRGRGVFAARDFRVGEVIEICPVIVLSADDAARLNDTYLYNYYFGWGADNREGAIALGFGSLYNHSNSPNANYRRNEADNTLSIIAVEPIAIGDEILIKYNFGTIDLCGQPWFEVR